LRIAKTVKAIRQGEPSCLHAFWHTLFPGEAFFTWQTSPYQHTDTAKEARPAVGKAGSRPTRPKPRSPRHKSQRPLMLCVAHLVQPRMTCMVAANDSKVASEAASNPAGGDVQALAPAKPSSAPAGTATASSALSSRSPTPD